MAEADCLKACLPVGAVGGNADALQRRLDCEDALRTFRVAWEVVLRCHLEDVDEATHARLRPAGAEQLAAVDERQWREARELL